MPGQVLILHGWSDTSKSFKPMQKYLAANGYDAKEVWLGDYISMDDDVRIEDAAKRMQAVVGELISAGEIATPFDLIVHSTGGLVAREWISTYYPAGTNAPVKRLIMLAPANFGSRLASLGKSMIGRIAKGWNNWFQTGTEMLEALELASPYQMELARKDLLDSAGEGRSGPYGEGKIWPFVIIGTHPYTSGTRQIANEAGADGTVRVAAANLNVSGLTIDFSSNNEQPELKPWSKRSGNIVLPFLVLPDREHGSVVQPTQPTNADDEIAAKLGQSILQALNCPSDSEYRSIGKQWYKESEWVSSLAIDKVARANVFTRSAPEDEHFEQYLQVVTHVRDDYGQPVSDYFIEFFIPALKGDAGMVRFQRDVLEHVHVNGLDSSLRCLFINRTALIDRYYARVKKPEQRQLAASISAAHLGQNVRYFNATKEGAEGHLIIHSEDLSQREQLGPARLHRNATHFLDIIIPRRPIDKVFKLSR